MVQLSSLVPIWQNCFKNPLTLEAKGKLFCFPVSMRELNKILSILGLAMPGKMIQRLNHKLDSCITKLSNTKNIEFFLFLGLIINLRSYF